MSPTTIGLLCKIYELGRAPEKKDFNALSKDKKVVASLAQTIPWHSKLKKDSNLSGRVKRVEPTLSLPEEEVERGDLYATSTLNRIRGSYSAYTKSDDEEDAALRAIRIFFERLPYPNKHINPDPFPDQAPKKYDLFRFLPQMRVFSATLERQIIKASELIFKILNPQTPSVKLTFHDVVNLVVTHRYRPPCHAAWKDLITGWQTVNKAAKPLIGRLTTIMGYQTHTRFNSAQKEGNATITFKKINSKVKSIAFQSFRYFLVQETLKSIFVDKLKITESVKNFPKKLIEHLEKVFLQSESLRRTFYFYCDLYAKAFGDETTPALRSQIGSFYENIEKTSKDKILKTFIWLVRNFMEWQIRHLLDEKSQIQLFAMLYFAQNKERRTLFEVGKDKATVDLGLTAFDKISKRSGWKFPLAEQLLFLNILMSKLENTHIPFLCKKEYVPFFASFKQPQDRIAMANFVKRLVVLVDNYNKQEPENQSEEASLVRFLKTLKEADKATLNYFYEEIRTLTIPLEPLSEKHLSGPLKNNAKSGPKVPPLAPISTNPSTGTAKTTIVKSLMATINALKAIEKACLFKIPASFLVAAVFRLIHVDIKKMHSLGTDLKIVEPAAKIVQTSKPGKGHDDPAFRFVTTCIAFEKLHLKQESKIDLQQLFTAFFHSPNGQSAFTHYFQAERKYSTHFNMIPLPPIFVKARDNKFQGTHLAETLNAFNLLVKNFSLEIAPEKQLWWLTKLTYYKEPVQLAKFFVRLAKNERSRIDQKGLEHFLEKNKTSISIPLIEKCVMATNLSFKKTIGVAKRILTFLKLYPHEYDIKKVNAFLQLIGIIAIPLPEDYTLIDSSELLDEKEAHNTRKYSFSSSSSTKTIPDEKMFLQALKNYCDSSFPNGLINKLSLNFTVQLISVRGWKPLRWLDIYAEFPKVPTDTHCHREAIEIIKELPLGTHHKILLAGRFHVHFSYHSRDSTQLRCFLQRIYPKISKEIFFRALFNKNFPKNQFLKAFSAEKDHSVITTFNEKAKDTKTLHRAIDILDKAKIPVSLKLLNILIETHSLDEFSPPLLHQLLSNPSDRDQLLKAYHKDKKVAVTPLEQKVHNTTAIEQSIAAITALEQAFRFKIPNHNRLKWISKLLYYSNPEAIASLLIKALEKKMKEGMNFEPWIHTIISSSQYRQSINCPDILARFQALDVDYLTPPDFEYRLPLLFKRTALTLEQIQQFLTKIAFESTMRPTSDCIVLEALERFYDPKVDEEQIEKQAKEIAEELTLTLSPVDWFEIYAYFPLLKKVPKEIPELPKFNLSTAHQLLLAAHLSKGKEDPSWIPRIQFLKGIETATRSSLPSDFIFPFLFLDTINKGKEELLSTILPSIQESQKNMRTSKALFVLPMIQSISEEIIPNSADSFALLWKEAYTERYYQYYIRPHLTDLLRITVTPDTQDQSTIFFPSKLDQTAPTQGQFQWAPPPSFGLGFAHRWETPRDLLILIIDLFHKGASQQTEARIKIPQSKRSKEFHTELQKMMLHLGPELPRVMIDPKTEIPKKFEDDTTEYLFWAKFFPKDLPQKPSQWTGQLFHFVKELKLGLRKGLQELVSGETMPIDTKEHPFKALLTCIGDQTKVSKLQLKGTNALLHYRPEKSKKGTVHVVTIDNPKKRRLSTYKYSAELTQEQLLPLLCWQLDRL